MGTRLVLKGRAGLQSFTDGIEAGDIVFNTKKVQLTAAEVLALFSAPKELLPAPGAGKYYRVLSVDLNLGFVSAYTIGSATNLNVHYTNLAGAATCVDLAATGFLDAVASTSRIVQTIATNVTPVTNAPLVLALDGANVTGGTSTLEVIISYQIIG